MAATIVAKYLRPASVRILFSSDSTWYLVIEARPATSTVKFIFGTIQRRFASAANICPCLFVVVIRTGKGHFGAFPGDHIFFEGAEFIPFFHEDAFHNSMKSGGAVWFIAA